MTQKKKPVVTSKTTKPKRKQPLAVKIDQPQHQEELESINKKLAQSQVELEAAYRQYTDLYDFAPVGYFTLMRNGAIHQINLAGANLLGVDHDEATRLRLAAFVSSESLPAFSVFFEKLLSGEGKENCELALKKKGSDLLWARLEATCFEGGHISRAMLTDITERKRIASLLQARVRISEFAESHTLDELLQKTLDEAEALTGSQIVFSHFLEADQKTLHLQAWSTNTLKNICSAEGKGSHYSVDQAGVWADCVSTRAPLIHNDYANLPASRRKGLPQGHAPVLRELVIPVLRNDLIVMIVGVGNKPTDYDGHDVESISQLANLAWDILQRKQADEQLQESEKRFRNLVETTSDWIWEIDASGVYTYASPRIRGILGFEPSEVIGKRPEDFMPLEEAQRVLNIFTSIFATRSQFLNLENKNLHRDGRTVILETSGIPIADNNGVFCGYRGIDRDITERKQAEVELQYMKEGLEAANRELQTALALQQQLAHTDALTGINNRRNLYKLAEHEFEIAARYLHPLSAIMFDIDHFKEVNDIFGHAVGDQMLQRVTQVACAKLRSADVIGRYGGEEFVIILPMTNAQQAYPLAERIRMGVAAIRVPTEKGDAAVTLSIGIVEMIRGAQNGSAEELIRRADEAMYAAKQAGRNRTEIGQ